MSIHAIRSIQYEGSGPDSRFRGTELCLRRTTLGARIIAAHGFRGRSQRKSALGSGTRSTCSLDYRYPPGVTHPRERSIRTHVELRVPAHLLARHAERLCGQTRDRIRASLPGLQDSSLVSSHETFIKTNNRSPQQRTAPSTYRALTRRSILVLTVAKGLSSVFHRRHPKHGGIENRN